jgi:hypothetical protein
MRVRVVRIEGGGILGRAEPTTGATIVFPPRRQRYRRSIDAITE